MENIKEPPAGLKPIIEAYGLEITEIQRVRDALRLNAAGKSFCLKRTHLSTARVIFLAHFAEHLKKGGFPQTTPILPTSDGSYFVSSGKETYYLTPWLKGGEGSLYDDGQLAVIARSMALFHLAARNFTPPPEAEFKSEWGQWPALLRNRCKDITDFVNNCLNLAKEGDFSSLFLEEAPYYLGQGLKALGLLDHSPYWKLSEQAQAAGTLCHYDIGGRNFIFSPDGEAVLIDLDLARFDLQLKDVAMLTYRTLEKREWSFSVFELILQNYGQINPLRTEDMEVLGILLLFPQRFWRLANRYKNRYHDWPENKFVHALEKYTGNKNRRESFLAEYSSRFLNYPLI